MNRIRVLFVACGMWFSLLSLAASVEAGTIALWTFETSVPTTPGPIAPEVGSGVGTSVHANTTGTHSNPSGNGSAESWNSNTWSIGDYYQFRVSTLGEHGITFSWDQTRSSAGPGQPSPNTPNFRLQYSTDGSNFTDHWDYLVPVVTWDSSVANVSTQYSQDLSAITSLDNQASVYFRLTAIQAPQNTGGQSRVDNVKVTSIPEPTGIVLVVAGLLATVLLRRPPT